MINLLVPPAPNLHVQGELRDKLVSSKGKIFGTPHRSLNHSRPFPEPGFTNWPSPTRTENTLNLEGQAEKAVFYVLCGKLYNESPAALLS
ncbi:kinase-like protein [Penicillium herquei]|nr:kinase-like protein [Penicillium herquei]